MKVHELITKLGRMPAEADVVITYSKRVGDVESYVIDSVDGGEMDDPNYIGNVNLWKGKVA